MGQSQVCSFCSNHEKEQDLFENKKDNFLILENKEKSLMETPILKQSNNNYPLSLNYIGGYSNYSFEGFNILRWSDNIEFKGYFHNCVPCGWGIFNNPKIGVFQGMYENNKPNGYGIYTHITDSLYEGYWANEKQEGYGIEKWKDGAIYEGEFCQGKKSGIGIYCFPNKNIYLGEWSQNLMNGYGIYSYGKNQLYIGQWDNGLRNGYGEIYGPKNNYFFGYFKNNLENGFFIFFNGKTKKIIIGFKSNGKVDGIVKYFKGGKEGKLIIVRNGRKIKEINDETKIYNYLNDPNNFDSIKDKCFIKYFLMERNELEKIINAKFDLEEFEEINKRLGRSSK